MVVINPVRIYRNEFRTEKTWELVPCGEYGYIKYSKDEGIWYHIVHVKSGWAVADMHITKTQAGKIAREFPYEYQGIVQEPIILKTFERGWRDLHYKQYGLFVYGTFTIRSVMRYKHA